MMKSGAGVATVSTHKRDTSWARTLKGSSRRYMTRGKPAAHGGDCNNKRVSMTSNSCRFLEWNGLGDLAGVAYT